MENLNTWKCYYWIELYYHRSLSRIHLGKRRNCSLWAIYSFSTMYLNIICKCEMVKVYFIFMYFYLSNIKFCILLIFCGCFVNPFPHTTILQQTTLNVFRQKLENLYNWMDNLWLKVENIVSKGEIARVVQFFFCHYVFK